MLVRQLDEVFCLLVGGRVDNYVTEPLEGSVPEGEHLGKGCAARVEYSFPLLE
jgi:hypothetical protein